MLIVVELNGLLVEKDRAGFFEGNAVLSLVLTIFPLVPLESQITHNYTVNMENNEVNMIFSLTRTRTRSSATGSAPGKRRGELPAS
jgi:hypothetical protein